MRIRDAVLPEAWIIKQEEISMRYFIITLAMVAALSAPCLAKSSELNMPPSVKAVTINGKLLSTDVKMVDGKAYIPVADLAKLFALSMQLDSQTGTLMLSGESVEGTNVSAAKEALRALETLQSVVKSGVTYRDYGPRRADAQVIVDRFLNESPNHPAAAPISTAMRHYANAGSFWEVYFSNEYRNDFLPLSDPQVAVYAKIYPEIESNAFTILGRKMIYLPYALSVIWNKASESISEARKVMR